jgi:hypothetical protein
MKDASGMWPPSSMWPASAGSTTQNMYCDQGHLWVRHDLRCVARHNGRMGLTQIARDDFDVIADALYGDGAWEISKAYQQSEATRNKRQAQIGLGANVLGITAGVAALGASARNPALRAAGADAEHAGPVIGGALRGKIGPFKVPRLKMGPTGTRRLVRAGAGGALGLQVANTAGDAVANRVLARESKKPISKALDVAQLKGKLTRTGVNAGFDAAGQAPVVAAKAKKATGGFVATVPISKRDDDKRQVFGWASVVELDGQPVIDLQGDYATIDVIEKAAYDYVQSSRRGGDMHQPGSNVSSMIESFMVTVEKKAALGLPDSTPTGWWVGFAVNDDATWQLVKEGKRPEFSIHGSGRRVDVEI